MAGDTNGQRDIFVHDRQTGTTTRVSIGADGTEANNSHGPTLSADGHYVAFQSDASNLVTGDTNKATDIFVYDRLEDEAGSVAPTGAIGIAIGLFLSFAAIGGFRWFIRRRMDLASRRVP